MNKSQDPDIKRFIKLTDPEKIYDIQDEDGQSISYEQASGRQLFNHYRHRTTNYDQVLDQTRRQQGYVSGYQQKQATTGAAEQILEQYRDEHVKVIRDAQLKGSILRTLMNKVGVGTAQALVNALDGISEGIKDVARLENSQRSLQAWNDTYRVQRELVKKVLKEEGVPAEAIAKVNKVYSTRSTHKAVELATDLFDLEKSEILKLIKSAVKYQKIDEKE
ncbi:MAG: hypothetical protein HC771_15915 [Synechococcales cyanobacterium CRU_2_2]|nr:hypothetical protein [Synechococcales cyanobacterium CRU_2_2]